MSLRNKLAALAILVVIVLFVWLVFQDRGTKTYIYPDFGEALPEGYTIVGIDVSHYQGTINWPQVDSMSIDGDSIRFAYIKCTEGLSFEDDMWKTNSRGLAKTSIPFGLYHFMRFDVSARKQAERFADKCLDAPDTLRPMLDIESTEGLSGDRLIDSVYVFMDTFEKRMKMRPVIYTFESFFEDYFKDSYLKNDLYWIANYNGETPLIELENVLIWQFSCRGTVNGIPGYVDLNVAKERFNELMFQD
jgi:lysozyme